MVTNITRSLLYFVRVFVVITLALILATYVLGGLVSFVWWRWGAFDLEFLVFVLRFAVVIGAVVAFASAVRKFHELERADRITEIVLKEHVKTMWNNAAAHHTKSGTIQP